MDFIEAKKGLYPIIGLLATLCIFFAGLCFVHYNLIWYYIAAIMILFIIFQWHKAVLMVLLIFIPIALFSFLTSMTFATLEEGIQNAIRMFLLGLSAIPSMTISHIDMGRTMNQLGLPKWLSLAVLICLRFTGVIKAEMTQIKYAMQIRGIRNGWINPKILYRGLLIPLIMRLLSISDMLTLSLETRGYSISSQNVTSYKIVRVKTRDIMFALCTLSIIIAGFMFILITK